jgi:sortase B
MKDGSMFGKLKKLYDQKFVDEWDAPLCFWILTPEGKYRYDIFSIHTVSATGETYTLFSGDSDEVGEYANTMARQSGVKLPQRAYHGQDRIITLSTCTSGDEYRLVVQGVLRQ